jgi:AcrR family transcriptional regulator
VNEIIAVARRLFATKGFASTSIDEIVRDAGVTKGALYHHFKSKEDVFAAVLHREQETLTERVRKAAMKESSAFGMLKAGCDAFLEASLDPYIQQICMIDAPAVVGATRLLEIAPTHSVGMIALALEHAMQQGELRERPAMPLAQIIFGALCQGAMVAARSEDPASTIQAIREEIQIILAGIQES